MAIAIVSGALANKPFNGGEAWVRLSWLLGLQRLGYETYFVEDLSSAACVDDSGERALFGVSANRAYFESVTRQFGLEGRASLLCDGGDGMGLGLDELIELASAAKVLFNISGHLTIEDILSGPRARVYVDLDPGFTQAWHADRALAFRLDGHDHYVTVGLNVGKPAWPIPASGIEWIPTLPPVVLDHWPAQPALSGPLRFTTVATWRSPYGGLEIGGRQMGLKHHQMRRMIELPERVEEAAFEIALDIHPGDRADLEALQRHGWRLVEPRLEAGTPEKFRDYVSNSGAEFSVVQGVYAETRSGWFSDRTAAYLASGRPALVQETGVGDGLATGAGLICFSSLEEAAAGAEQLAAEATERGAAAREFAERNLDSDVVLGELLSKLGVGA